MNMLVEMIPLIETSTGNVLSWKIGRCFRLNPPKPKKEEIKQEKLEVNVSGDLEL